MGLISGSLRGWLRAVVDKNPALSYIIRAIREKISWQRQRPAKTPYGFLLVGHPTMQSGNFEPEETQLRLLQLYGAEHG